MTLRQSAQQALEALERGETKLRWAAISALKAALAEPEQEPVGWQWLDTANYRKNLPADAIREHWRPLYTAPTPRTLLTDYINAANINGADSPHMVVEKLQSAIERAHGITGENK